MQLGPVLALRHNALLIYLSISAIYTLLLSLASPVAFFLLIFPYLSTSSLAFSFKNRPALFQARGHKRQPNLGFSVVSVYEL